MCGVCGLLTSSGLTRETLEGHARRMSEQLRHRGPDDAGVFADADSGIAFGHRRLSVVDLSAHGHQPMTSASGRYVITYNGEIFNHLRLRQELQPLGLTFRGHSDTEAMLVGIEHWGLEHALQHFTGMFAFALWDREQRKLLLVRDRLGIKPLYYGWVGPLFVFASELKAICALPTFNNEINRDALGLLLRHGYIPAPYSIYRDIYKLVPGTWLRVDQRTASHPIEIVKLTAIAKTYWSAREVAEHGTTHRVDMPDEEAIGELDALLRDAVALRMEADVPLGTFLSGGIDSSAVTALMQAQAKRPVKTFSIGFHERAFDEAPFAKAVANHLGTDHHELRVTARDALDVVPELPSIYDEPFADPSQIPTYLVSKLARGTVTVSLSGDGGDELFGGYSRYFEAERYRRFAKALPTAVRHGAAAMLCAQDGFSARLFSHVCQLLPARLQPRNPHNVAATLGNMLGARNDAERYVRLVSHWDDALRVVLNCHDVPTALRDYAQHASLATPLEKMMYADLLSYLPDDCLTKVDRASMAVSLEVRVPLLDHRVVAFAWQTPLRQKIRNGQGKWLLRQVLYRYVPKALVDRPKMGFGVPIGDWLRGPLRGWAETLLDERRLRAEGFFDPVAIRRVWNAHVNGRANEPYRLWNVLMFQAWLEKAAKATSG